MRLFDHLEVPYEETDKDVMTACLWCGSDKLSVSKDEGHVFSCWKCKQTGNGVSYMREWFSQLPDLTMPQAKQFCGMKKGVSPSALRLEGIRCDGHYYWFPVRNMKGDIIALHKYNPSDNIVYSSPKPWNATVLGLCGLTGCSTLFVAEGHWDYLCLKSHYTSSEYDVIGTCGSSFATSYLHVLEDKDVVLLFDNDDAGQSGVQSVARRIKTSGHVVKSLRFLDWSQITVPKHASLPQGFDIRDLHNTMKGAV
jgi:hypothetical protein